MPISNEALDAMVNAGMTAEQIVSVIKADRAKDEQAAELAIADKRQRDRDRKRQSRLSAKSHGQAVTSRDIADTAQVIEFATAAGTSHRGRTPDCPPDKPKPSPIEKPSPSFTLTSEEEKKEEGSVIARAKAKRGMRLPDNWTLSENDLAFARTLLPESRIAIEFDKFRDHWRASARPNAVKLDWSAAWRNWCRNAINGVGYAQANQRTGNRESQSAYTRRMAKEAGLI